ncbi:MAG: class I SAM-dependent methyltransferase [Clostridia bacterium]|nr:class I SAM-dependent methyltransferase [Clostridia bacterium]
MNIVQKFYDDLADQYDKLFLDWNNESEEQGVILDELFQKAGLDRSAKVLDCACGIGTQSIGLAKLGYSVVASDISERELEQGKSRAKEQNLDISFTHADFCELDKSFGEQFDAVICMDNALPHMLTTKDLEKAIKSIVGQISPNGIFLGSIRDYDELILSKPTYSPPYIHECDKGRRVAFQIWSWSGDIYQFTQYLIEDEAELKVNKFDCKYRAIRRAELTGLLLKHGCREVEWKFPEETGFYQPIVVAKK